MVKKEIVRSDFFPRMPLSYRSKAFFYLILLVSINRPRIIIYYVIVCLPVWNH